MLRYSRLTVTACTALLLFACSTAPTKQDQGVIIGAIAGGIIGNQLAGGRLIRHHLQDQTLSPEWTQPTRL